MNTYYLALAVSLVFYLILLVNYTTPDNISSSMACNPEITLCIVCPDFNSNSPRHKFGKYTQIQSQISFQFLGTKHSTIKKNQCKDLLGLFGRNSEGELTLPESIHRDIKSQAIALKASHQINLSTGKKYHLTVSDAADFILFFQDPQLHYPTIKIQSEQNPERLMKMGRCMCWAALFALLLKSIDRKVGILTERRESPFPLPQLSVLSFILYSSYDMNRFSFVFIAEQLFLVYLLFMIFRSASTSQKILVAVVFLSIFGLSLFYEQVNLVGDFLCLYCIKRKMPKLTTTSPKIKTITVFLLLCIVANSLEMIGSFNLFIYSAYAIKIILIPLTFLIMQENQLSEETREKLSQTADKYLESLE